MRILNQITFLTLKITKFLTREKDFLDIDTMVQHFKEDKQKYDSLASLIADLALKNPVPIIQGSISNLKLFI